MKGLVTSMNILGHPYVAFKTIGKLTPLVVAGSLLPDLVPFVPNSVFTFQEIHESPDLFFDFLQRNYPKKKDLALGMMSHSVKLGADKFNQEIEGWLLAGNQETRKELAEKIVDCSGVSAEVAEKFRLHNYLWLGIDVYLLKNKQEFIIDLAKVYPQIDCLEIATLLSEAFQKDTNKVLRMVDYLLLPLTQKQIVTLDDLSSAWRIMMAGLPEKDNVNETKAFLLFEEIYERFEEKWEKILEGTIGEVGRTMEPFLGS